MQSVLVVGGGGYIGNHLVSALRQTGYLVRSLSSQVDGCFDLDTGVWRGADDLTSQVDTVFYLSQSPHYRLFPLRTSHVLNVNVVSAVALAEQAVASGVRRFIYVSTGNVYRPSFEPLNESSCLRQDDWYGVTKAQAEGCLSLFAPHMRVSLVRLFGVYGPAQVNRLVPRLIDRLRRSDAVEVERNPTDPSDLDGLRISLTYVDDIVHGLILIGSQDHTGPINLASPSVVSIRDLCSALAQRLKVIPQVRLSDRFRQGDLIADVSLFTRLYKAPFTSLDTGLTATLELPEN